MPHKVNPMDFENAEGKLGLANALLKHLSEKLPISRWQRDLTDSIVLRNMGVVAVGYAVLAYQSLNTGLGKLEINQAATAADLDASWEVLGEPMTRELMPGFIARLEVPEADKQRLLAMMLGSYTGMAAELANRAKHPPDFAHFPTSACKADFASRCVSPPESV